MQKQLLELQKKQSEQKDKTKAKQNPEESKDTPSELKDKAEGSSNNQTVTYYQKNGRNIARLNSITESP